MNGHHRIACLPKAWTICPLPPGGTPPRQVSNLDRVFLETFDMLCDMSDNSYHDNDKILVPPGCNPYLASMFIFGNKPFLFILGKWIVQNTEYEPAFRRQLEAIYKGTAQYPFIFVNKPFLFILGKWPWLWLKTISLAEFMGCAACETPFGMQLRLLGTYAAKSDPLSRFLP